MNSLILELSLRSGEKTKVNEFLRNIWKTLGETDRSLKDKICKSREKRKKFSISFGGCTWGRIQFSRHLSRQAYLSSSSLEAYLVCPRPPMRLSFLHKSVTVVRHEQTHTMIKWQPWPLSEKKRSLNSGYGEKQN